MRIGILANEFFDDAVGPFGGFGWAAQTAAAVLGEAGIDVVFIAGHRRARWWSPTLTVHGRPFIEPRRDPAAARRQLALACIDALLAIDYRPSYDDVLMALPDTAVVVWVRDPRPPADVEKVASLRLPWAPAQRPKGIDPVDCRGLSEIARTSATAGRSLQLATPELQLSGKVADTYGIADAGLHLLPNVVDPGSGAVEKAHQPTVVFLGRLDPIKRPWLAIEVARAMPHVTFLLMGRAHLGNALPRVVPPNVKRLGHVDGAEKRRLLGSAWALLNTSIHEALAVSFLEALSCEAPLVSCQNPGDIVATYGKYVGRFDGDGLAGIGAFVTALEALFADEARRRHLGAAGRRWVAHTHSKPAFLAALDRLLARAGLSQRQITA